MKNNLKKIDLNIKNENNENFIISKFNTNSTFTLDLQEDLKDINVEYYLISEIRGSLNIEGEGSSRKVIKELISGKRKPQSSNEQKAFNLYTTMKYIDEQKPSFNKKNLMIIYNMLKQDIDLGDSELENDFDYRQSSDGVVQKFSTPSEKVMRAGMDKLIVFFNGIELDDFPIEKSMILQILFIYFHPFYDLNGRTGRLITYWFLTLKGYDKLKNVVYMSLPNNKRQYIKIWQSIRKFKIVDLTFFLNWLGSLTIYSVTKLIVINDYASKRGMKLNDTESLILFTLFDKEQYYTIHQIMTKLDLGISKQGIMKSVKKLIESKMLISKVSKNTLHLAPIAHISADKKWGYKELFKKWSKEQSNHGITLGDAIS